MFVGIYGGFFTPTEGAAVATAATLALALARRKLSWSQVVQCSLPAAQATAMIYTMLLGAAMMNTALAVSQVPADVAAWTTGLDVHPLLVVAGFLAVFIVLTCILDELAMMLLLLPVLLPTILGLDLFGMTKGRKAIWFGILMLVVVSVGLIAPPIGLDVYVVHNIAKTVPIGEIYRGIFPFLGVGSCAHRAPAVLLPSDHLVRAALPEIAAFPHPPNRSGQTGFRPVAAANPGML